jgi:SAM-dependent methyltransferase
MTEITCRSCGCGGLLDILALGKVPLANALLTTEDLAMKESRYPLNLVFCSECTLVQISESVDPAILFKDYVYYSSFSGTMLRHATDLCTRLTGERQLDSTSLVVEIASNDGYLLKNYVERGIPVLGIEPAANIAEKAIQDHQVPTLCEFFDDDLAERLRKEGSVADLVHAHNVFAHVPDPNLFAAGLKKLLKVDGLGVIEAPYLRDFIDHLEFDTIYHEHYSYFSLHATVELLARHGLAVINVERVPIHGGTLRYFVGHEGMEIDRRVDDMLREERDAGLCHFPYYEQFADHVWELKRDLKSLLATLRTEKKRVAAYGASAKGSTLMNAFGIGADEIEFVVDRSTVKQGCFTPGTRIPILAPEALLEQRPDYVLLLTWNFADEILEQQAAYRESGGLFIVPVPSVRIV